MPVAVHPLAQFQLSFWYIFWFYLSLIYLMWNLINAQDIIKKCTGENILLEATGTDRAKSRMGIQNKQIRCFPNWS